jgi:hypothetical protein
MNSYVHFDKRERGAVMKKSTGILAVFLVCCILVMPVFALPPWEDAQTCDNYSMAGFWFGPNSVQYPSGEPQCGKADVSISWINDELVGPGNIDRHTILGYNIYRTPDDGGIPESGILIGPPGQDPYLFSTNDDDVNLPGRFFWVDSQVAPDEYDYILVVWTAGKPGSSDSTPAPGCYLWQKVNVPQCNAPSPEFPSGVIPVTMIIGVLGAVLLLRKAGEH